MLLLLQAADQEEGRQVKMTCRSTQNRARGAGGSSPHSWGSKCPRGLLLPTFN